VADFIRAIDIPVHAQTVADAYRDPGTDAVHYAAIEADLSRLQGAKTVPAAVTRAISDIAASGSDIRALCQGHDRGRAGSITPHQAQTVLASASALSAGEIKDVVSFYGDGGAFRYAAFVEAIEESRRVEVPGGSVSFGGRIVDTRPILANLQQEFEARRVDVPSLFEDAIVDGVVTNYAFLRVLSQAQSVIRADQINVLARRFDAGGGAIDLPAFLACFPREQPVREVRNVSPTLERIRERLASHRTALRPRLQRCVHGGNTELCGSLVRDILQKCGILFAQGEFEALQEEYEAGIGLFDWQRLCDDVEDLGQTAPPAEEIEEQPSPRRSRALMTPRKMPLLRKLSEACLKQGVFILADFQRMDKYKRGYVSETDFLRQLTILGNPLSRQEISRLFTSYQDASTGNFDYLSFCRDLESPATASGVVVENPDLKQAVRHYKAFLKSRRVIHPRSIFERFDRAGTGHVPLANLQTAFVSAGIDFTKEELSALKSAFTDAAFPDRFWYRKLDAAAETEEVSPAEIRFLLNPSFAQEEQTRMRTGALTEIREKLLARRRTIGFVFAGLEEDTITVAELQQRLAKAGLIPSKPQIDVLAVFYGKGDGLFDWKAFREDCEASAIVGTRM
jgi:Ca2+-binding EF-hand superfamily protein